MPNDVDVLVGRAGTITLSRAVSNWRTPPFQNENNHCKIYLNRLALTLEHFDFPVSLFPYWPDVQGKRESAFTTKNYRARGSRLFERKFGTIVYISICNKINVCTYANVLTPPGFDYYEAFTVAIEKDLPLQDN